MRVAAIVVAYDSAADLAGCLSALLGQDHTPPVDVVVVDNASGDESLRIAREVAAEHTGRVRVRANATNRGFAGGVNDGLAEVGDAEAVLLCNPDAAARPDHVRRLVAVLAAHPRCGAVQGKLLRRDHDAHRIDSAGHSAHVTRLFRNIGETEADRGQHDAPCEVFGVSGACALYRRAMLDDVALVRGDGRREALDEDLFAYFEDVDLDWRARLRGWHARYEPSAVAVHERGGAGPRRSRRVEALNWRNRLLVVTANDHLPSLLRHAPAVLATTVLKTLELVVTEPGALTAALRSPAWRRVASKRRQVQSRATVPPGDVVADWFAPFDYRRWVATWWRRVR